MTSTPGSATGSRGRTRRAILDAALSVLAQRGNAPLSEVAEAAGVGRSTLHRYFPERSDLIAALADDAVEAAKRAATDAAPQQGPADEALRRVVHAYFELAPYLNLLFNEPQLAEDERFWDGLDEANQPAVDLIERGQREGTVDAGFTADWISRVLWWLILAGWDAVNEGAMPRHGAPATIIRTLERGVLPPPAG